MPFITSNTGDMGSTRVGRAVQDSAVQDSAVPAQASMSAPNVSAISPSTDRSMSLWSGLLGFFVLQLTFAVGVVASTGVHIGEAWKTMFLVLAGLALGFGAGFLLYRHCARSKPDELERDYQGLKGRAERLLARLDRLETASRAEPLAARPGSVATQSEEVTYSRPNPIR
jgi:hypothetical protein